MTQNRHKKVKASLSDETKIINNVKDGNILEIGFGNGDILSILSDFGQTVYGTETSEELVNNAKDRGIDNVILCEPSEISNNFISNSFDTIILNGTVSKVFSDKRNESNSPHHLADLEGAKEVLNLLKDVYSLLKDEGIVIIRGGARVPVYNGDDLATFRMHLDEIHALDDYRDYKFNTQEYWKTVMFTEDIVLVACSLNNATEFLYSYFDDENIFTSRETRKGFLPIDDFKYLLESIGFEEVDGVSYHQDKFIEKFKSVNFLNMTSVDSTLPDSNIILIGRK